jgi:hypothetical protein
MKYDADFWMLAIVLWKCSPGIGCSLTDAGKHSYCRDREAVTDGFGLVTRFVGLVSPSTGECTFETIVNIHSLISRYKT